MAAKSPLPQSPAANNNSYHEPQPQPRRHDDETLSNTLANSHLAELTTQYYTEHLQPPQRQPKFTEQWDASRRGSSIIDGPTNQHHQYTMQRSNSVSSRPDTTAGDGTTSGQISLSRSNTLKKKASLRRGGSLKRSSSRRSMKAGSVRSLALQSSHDTDEAHSAFYCPVPTHGNPTESLANRFQAWRKILKDLITYFREIQSHYEHRSKSLLKLANVVNNTATPAGFLASGGLDDALQILRNYHKTAITEANKAREIEEDVILALTGLRSDLNQKMKEIKSLSGDFKNTVDKEMDNTRKAVNALQDVLGQTELDSALTTGKQDPYLLRLAVDRQVERQLDEENYLHQAYLNLESSGRELESIVVGEIQKSYNAYAGILKRESDNAYNAIEELRGGPISMPKDHEWHSFIQRDTQFIDPELPIRSADQINYPGKDHFACQEIRAGLLERKSKYLKSYTAGWYVLSPTHLHEFKSADKVGAPVMSLYLPEQKLGSHSAEGGSSNKFILKGRQTGTMHRGHTWVFRAESHDTMMAWYEDIKALTEKSPEERSSFVRGHARTYSRSSQRSMSSDGMVDDDVDEEPFVSTADAAAVVAPVSPGSRQDSLSRPEGGRFPSDLQVNAQRGLQVPHSPSSNASSTFLNHQPNDAMPRSAHLAPNRPTTAASDYDIIAAAGALPGSVVGNPDAGTRMSQLMVGQTYGNTSSVNMESVQSHAAMIHNEARQDGVNPYSGEPIVQPSSPSHRISSVPEVVSGSTQVSSRGLGSGSNQEAGYFRNSGERGAMNGEPVYMSGVVDYASLKQMPSNTGNGFIPGKGGNESILSSPMTNGGGDTETASLLFDTRPSPGNRTNSTPHIPGEYPRGTPVTTPELGGPR